ncbi:MAG: 4Fe-4S binding protein [Bacteroidetes bacterium]|nr:4Fe-4S binding protein [Bacteroidota bacterium]MCL5025918.1 4Fe-4S binding protein [Chloroflexota bacterium]
MFRQIMMLPARCLACGACELACALQWQSSRGTAIAHGRLRVRLAAGQPLPLLCRHCRTAPCVDACPAGAMQRDGGRVFVDTERCVGCWSCVMVCPTCQVMPRSALEEDAPGPASPRGFAFKCDGCPDELAPPCVAACPTGALLAYDQRQLAALLGERRRSFAARILSAQAPDTASNYE